MNQEAMAVYGATRGDEATVSLIDVATVEVLARDVGEPRLGTVLGMFAAELARRSPLLQRAVDRRDLAALARESHSIKGSALTFGAPALAAAARRTNDAARSLAADAAVAACREMLLRLPETCRAVQQLIDTRCTRGAAQ
jgi:HPt (histidine-containing phosphotransfer) domain-containing protein